MDCNFYFDNITIKTNCNKVNKTFIERDQLRRKIKILLIIYVSFTLWEKSSELTCIDIMIINVVY